MDKIKKFCVNNKIAIILGVVLTVLVVFDTTKDYTEENNKLKSEIIKIEKEIEKKNLEIAKKSAPQVQEKIDTLSTELKTITNENKNLKSEKSELEVAYKEKVKETKQARLNSLLSGQKINYDEVEKTSWIYYPGSPKYINVNNMELYLGVKNGSVWPRVKIQYTDDSWLFIKNYKIITDTNSYSIYPTSVERGNDHRIWEWYDWDPSEANLKMIEDIANSSNVIIRHEGKQYYDDRTVSSSEKQGMKNILELYNLLQESKIELVNGKITATIK